MRVDVVCDRCGPTSPRVLTPAGEVEPFRVLSESGDATPRWQVLIGLDLETPPGAYRLAVHEPERDAPGRTVDLRVSAKPFATRRLRVPPGFVEPSASDRDRIAAEAARLDALFRSTTPRRWSGPFVAPVTTPATSNFGTRSIFNGEPRARHAGVDFRAATGAPIVAPGAGRIVLAGDLFFTGKTVVIDHGAGLFSLLAHLSAVTVAADHFVDRGAPIGRVGATGRATGPHLHWSVRLNGARVDPLSLLFATGAEGRDMTSAHQRGS